MWQSGVWLVDFRKTQAMWRVGRDELTVSRKGAVTFLCVTFSHCYYVKRYVKNPCEVLTGEEDIQLSSIHWCCGCDFSSCVLNKLCGKPRQYAPAPCKLTISSYLFARWRDYSDMLAFKTSATSWPLTFWSWKWYPSHVWRGLPLCQFYSF